MLLLLLVVDLSVEGGKLSSAWTCIGLLSTNPSWCVLATICCVMAACTWLILLLLLIFFKAWISCVVAAAFPALLLSVCWSHNDLIQLLLELFLRSVVDGYCCWRDAWDDADCPAVGPRLNCCDDRFEADEKLWFFILNPDALSLLFNCCILPPLEKLLKLWFLILELFTKKLVIDLIRKFSILPVTDVRLFDRCILFDDVDDVNEGDRELREARSSSCECASQDRRLRNDDEFKSPDDNFFLILFIASACNLFKSSWDMAAWPAANAEAAIFRCCKYCPTELLYCSFIRSCITSCWRSWIVWFALRSRSTSANDTAFRVKPLTCCCCCRSCCCCCCKSCCWSNWFWVACCCTLFLSRFCCDDVNSLSKSICLGLKGTLPPGGVCLCNWCCSCTEDSPLSADVCCIVVFAWLDSVDACWAMPPHLLIEASSASFSWFDIGAGTGVALVCACCCWLPLFPDALLAAIRSSIIFNRGFICCWPPLFPTPPICCIPLVIRICCEPPTILLWFKLKVWFIPPRCWGIIPLPSISGTVFKEEALNGWTLTPVVEFCAVTIRDSILPACCVVNCVGIGGNICCCCWPSPTPMIDACMGGESFFWFCCSWDNRRACSIWLFKSTDPFKSGGLGGLVTVCCCNDAGDTSLLLMLILCCWAIYSSSLLKLLIILVPPRLESEMAQPILL